MTTRARIELEPIAEWYPLIQQFKLTLKVSGFRPQSPDDRSVRLAESPRAAKTNPCGGREVDCPLAEEERSSTPEPARTAHIAAGRLGGLTSWGRDRERMLQVAASGNEALLRRLGNRSAVRLHFVRLAERRWRRVKSEGYRW